RLPRNFGCDQDFWPCTLRLRVKVLRRLDLRQVEPGVKVRSGARGDQSQCEWDGCFASTDAVLASGARCKRRRSCAFAATTTVDRDMSTAPTAIGMTKPMGASTPAASGTASRL